MMKDSPCLPFLRGVLEKQLKSSWSGDDCFLVLLFRIAVKKVGVMKKNDSELQCSCRTPVHWGYHWYPLVVLGTIDAFFLYLCWDQRSSLHLDE